MAALAKCELPFQCAHGRPSMAPLVRLEMGGGKEQKVRTEEVWVKEVRTRLKGMRVMREMRGSVADDDARKGVRPLPPVQMREEMTVE